MNDVKTKNPIKRVMETVSGLKHDNISLSRQVTAAIDRSESILPRRPLIYDERINLHVERINLAFCCFIVIIREVETKHRKEMSERKIKTMGFS